MNTKRYLPQSFFWRIWWLICCAMFFSKIMTLVYIFFNEDALVDRQYSYGISTVIRTYWTVDEKQREILAEKIKLKTHSTNEAIKISEEHWPYTQIFQNQIKKELGENSKTMFQLKPTPALWVFVPDLGPDWVSIEFYPHTLSGNKLLGLIFWMGGVILIALGLSYIFVKQISAPFDLLVKAVRNLGKGYSKKLEITNNLPCEVLEVYQAFNTMLEDVKNADKEREVMLAGVSHDLRTPLTRIRLRLSLLEDETNSNEIKEMVNDIEIANSIISQFINFIHQAQSPADLCDIYQLITTTANAFNQTGQKVTLDLAKNLPKIAVHPIFIDRMLSNLIQNALAYGDDSAEVVAYQEQNNLIIKVLDNGDGIDPNLVEQLFTPFMRGDKARNKSGSGLGLAIAKKICTKYNGTIELINRDCGGLEARVTLPITPPTTSRTRAT